MAQEIYYDGGANGIIYSIDVEDNTQANSNSSENTQPSQVVPIQCIRTTITYFGTNDRQFEPTNDNNNITWTVERPVNYKYIWSRTTRFFNNDTFDFLTPILIDVIPDPESNTVIPAQQGSFTLPTNEDYEQALTSDIIETEQSIETIKSEDESFQVQFLNQVLQLVELIF